MNPTQGGSESGPPRKIGNYRIEERLGSGGMGVVYRAFDEALQRPLAIKHLLSAQDNPVAVRRFRREAQAAARLNHPTIVHIYDIVETGDGEWIVMELVEGKTLTSLIRQGGLDLSEAVRLGREITDGLAEAHAHGIIHRDLKASNVMVTQSGHAKILDFGLAKFFRQESEPDLSQSGIVFGTYHAMSPEQAQGLPLDHRSDLFSLGSLLYEMLTGASPFRASTVPETLRRICSLQHLPACQIRPEIPRELSDMIDLLLAKQPGQRLQSAREVAKCLEETVDALRRPAEPKLQMTLSEGQITLVDGLAGKLKGLDPSPAPPSPDPSRSSSERRQITVVCCELVGADGSTGSSSRGLDPETLYELMLQLRTLTGEVVRRHGGHLGSTMGHRMLIYFGYPQTYEDNARRATLTALELVDEVARMKTGSDRGRPLRMALRAGIHTGPAVVATSPHSPEPVMLGATLEVATELQSLAEPGSVVVSPATGALVQKNFSLAALPPVMLPGLATPLTPLRVLGPTAMPEDSSADLLPLVGRGREMELLVSRWDLVSEGTGQVAVVSGEAGIGKSRLVLALRDRLGAAARWLSCGGSPYTQNSPLRPLADLMRQAVALRPETSPLERLESLLESHGLAEALPLFAALLDLPLAEGHPAPNLSPEKQRDRTLEALTAWVLDMAERQPLVLLIEDLHWLDPTTLDWLGRLIDQTPAAPLFLVLTLRLHTVDALWGPRAHLTQITLNPLTESEAKILIDHVAGEGTLSATVRRQIAARTDGVPLFIEELTKTVLESSDSGDRRDLPSTLRDSLTARLDRLGTVKEVAQLASAIGREFSFDLLAAVSPRDEATLHRELKQLVQAELIYRKGFGAQTKYLFKHALVQDAAYDSLLNRERQQIHRQIAEALVSRFQETAETQPELLAHHYTEAGLTEPAVESWHRAGLLASSRSAGLEAISHFNRALELLESLPESQDRDRRELDLQNALAAATITGRGYVDPGVRKAYARAQELAERAEGKPEDFWILQGLHLYHQVRGDLPEALRLAHHLLRSAESKGDPVLISTALFCLGSCYFFLTEFRAALHNLERSLELAPPEDLTYRNQTGTDLRVVALGFSCLVLWHLGHADKAWKRAEEALALARGLEHPHSLLAAHVFAGAELRHYLRDGPGVQRHAREILQIAEEWGFSYWIPEAKAFLAWGVHHSNGGSAEVTSPEIPDSETLRQMVEQHGGVAGSYFFCILVEVLMREGQPEEAQRALNQGLAIVTSRGEWFWDLELYRLQGDLLAQSGDSANLEEAERWFRKALEIARRQEARSLELRSAVSLGRLWYNRGRKEESLRLLTDLYGGFTEGFDSNDLQEARALLDQIS